MSSYDRASFASSAAFTKGVATKARLPVLAMKRDGSRETYVQSGIFSTFWTSLKYSIVSVKLPTASLR
jgi:hypothetical protein